MADCTPLDAPPGQLHGRAPQPVCRSLRHGLRPHPRIHCLKSFEALARLRSVSLAAEERSVTPSAISHRILQVERQLGTRLF